MTEGVEHLSIGEFRQCFPEAYAEFHDFVLDYYYGDDDGSDDEIDALMEESLARAEFGVIDKKLLYYWWQDPGAPVNAGSDAYCFMELDGTLVEIGDVLLHQLIERVEGSNG